MSAVGNVSASSKISIVTPGFARLCVALILSGFSAFSALYCMQPILPILAADFQVSPAAASLSVTVTTVALAAGLLVAGPLSDAVGRKPVILASMLAAGVMMMATALAPTWHLLIAARALLGLLLGGITAINLAYLAEEMEPASLGQTIGLVLAGNSVGGMIARLSVGVAAEHMDWRWPVAAIGLMSLGASVLMALWLPPSRHFRPTRLDAATVLGNYRRHLTAPGLTPAFMAGFLLMGCFVAFFNYLGFRLLAPPFSLNQSVVGLISLVFLPSSYAAVEAGKLSDRLGAARVHVGAIAVMGFGLALTAAPVFWLLGLGTLLFTLGFFGAHSVAVGHVGRRARIARAQATALYQIAFYVGASVAGTIGGLFWQALGWNGILLLLGTLLALAALNGRQLR